jgi:hypothetical protein
LWCCLLAYLMGWCFDFWGLLDLEARMHLSLGKKATCFFNVFSNFAWLCVSSKF